MNAGELEHCTLAERLLAGRRRLGLADSLLINIHAGKAFAAVWRFDRSEDVVLVGTPEGFHKAAPSHGGEPRAVANRLHLELLEEQEMCDGLTVRQVQRERGNRS